MVDNGGGRTIATEGSLKEYKCWWRCIHTDQAIGTSKRASESIFTWTGS